MNGVEVNTDNIANEPDRERDFGLRKGAEEFPLMVVISTIYPCNYGCPNCPYTDTNSEIRTFYRERNGELFPVKLWESIARECGEYGAWMRCTGGGEPMLHPKMTEMIEYAKYQGARVWLNTNGSLFGPPEPQRKKLERLIRSRIDLIEFSMDAADAETYSIVRPPRGGAPRDPNRWWQDKLSNIRFALQLRKELKSPTRIVVSIIRQKIIENKIDDAVRFWIDEIKVDEVITRKFLTWDDNTSISFENSADTHLYADLPTEKKEPCVWPFERLNVDTLGQIALCGQDISFRTAGNFPNANDVSIKKIWLGAMFNWYREMHLSGRGAEAWPCRGCSAWKAGIRDWHYGWLRVLHNAGERMKSILNEDLGAEVDVFSSQRH